VALKVARRGRVPPFIVMDVMQAAALREAAGAHVLHLELGQPSSGTPRSVVAAAQRALERETLGYTLALGLDPLRERIAAHYRDRHGVALDPSRVVVTTGSSGAFVLSFLAAFDEGDRVALADPSYPGYRNILLALGIEPVGLPTGPETRFQPTVELIARAGPLDGLIVASPSNPAGTVIDAGEFARIVAYCRAAGIRLISDEIYHGITYGRAAMTALALDPDALVINSFSKYFSMTGWRIGWMVCPPDLARAVECLAQNIYISPPTLAQHAAVAAFDCTPELEANVARYAENRALLLEGLPRAGLDRIAPADGAFYLYADVSALTNDSEAFCARMLAEAGVATTPGIDFDQGRGRAYLRISYAGASADMAAAVDRLETWMKRG
jgi:aspartate/methionine/tyrosine aminotransferase